MNPGYRKRTIVLLIVLLVVRFWFGQTFGLSGREAYLWLEGHGVNLSPAYWERGPLTPLLVRIGTFFFGDTELGVRWPAAVIACLSGFTLFYLARDFSNARTAFWTVVLFVVLPLYAWKLSFTTEATAAIGLRGLALLAMSRAIERDTFGWWLLTGAACGLAMLISIANAWWLAGFLLFLLIIPVERPWLREPRLWSMLIAAVLFLAPLVWWWHGPQVADIRRTRLVSDWPLSHAFSFSQGLHFVLLEIVCLSPLFVLALAVAMVRAGRGWARDPRHALLIWAAVPGLAWENFAAFFDSANFELVPALFLPLVLLAGLLAARLTAEGRARDWIWGGVLALAAVESVVGLRAFYLTPEETGSRPVARALRGQALAGLGGGIDRSSWRNLADQMVQMQHEVGANLFITDTPAVASALSFYLPHHPSIYVEEKPDVVTQFDFWPHYTDAASPNDSALFITRSTDASPPPDLTKNFATVTPLPDMPLPGFDKSWNLWNCQGYTGNASPAGASETGPMRESDALPK